MYSMSYTSRLSVLSNAESEEQGHSNSTPAKATQDTCSSSGQTSVHPMKAGRQEFL